MMSRLGSIVEIVSHAGGRVAAVFVLAMGLLITVDVILRYVFNAPTQIATEVSGYLMVGVAFLGVSYTLIIGGHIRIEIVTSRLPEKIGNPLELITSLLSLAFVGVLIWPAWHMVLESYAYRAAALSYLHTPLYLPQSLVAVGLCLLAAQLVVHIAHIISRINSGGR